MAGLSSKLSSLVEAVEDPYPIFFAYTHLGVGVSDDSQPGSRGFRGRIESLRNQFIARWLSPQGRMNRQMKRQQMEPIRDLQEIAELNRQEQLLASQLFQTSTLHLVARHLFSAVPGDLRTHVSRKEPMVRFLAIRAIGVRHIHLETELIERLNDPDSVVREEAHTALVRVVRGTDFGPIPGASQRGIARSVEKWRQWLALQQDTSSDTPSKGITGDAKPDRLDTDKAIKLVLDRGSRELQTASPEATRLRDELLKAKGDEQTTILARLRDAKGIDNTDALALAIPKLSAGAAQREARDALVQRLKRMKAATLRDKLQEDAIEVRRAAALACGRKQDREHIPDLLQLLDDPEIAVIQAARQALKDLTGQDFGPEVESGRRGRASATSAWRKWWKEHQDSP